MMYTGYHQISFEYYEHIASGSLSCYIAKDGNPNAEKAQLTRFRVLVPNYSDSQIDYIINTHTYFGFPDKYYLQGYADDSIANVALDGQTLWYDWEWDLGSTHLYAWGGGFSYPLQQQYVGWRNIQFSYGENTAGGLLDFRYISQTKQPDSIGGPKFWTKVHAEGTNYLTMYEAKAWTGSKWFSDPGTSMRTISTTVEVLVNATDTNTFLPLPQQAQVSLSLYNLSSLYSRYTPQDIMVVVNMTYTYFIGDSLFYGMPIVFQPYSVVARVADQGSMMYIPYPSLIFYNQTHNSPISTEWKW